MRTLAVRGLRLVGLLAVLTVGGAGGWPLAVFADAAPPWEPGDAIGEPTGAVAHVAITHEDLGFDLRPLADANRCRSGRCTSSGTTRDLPPHRWCSWRITP